MSVNRMEGQAKRELIPPTAAEVKASLGLLIARIDQAWKVSYGYNGAPKYVLHGTSHIEHKLLDLKRETQNLLNSCPERFQGQTRD